MMPYYIYTSVAWYLYLLELLLSSNVGYLVFKPYELIPLESRISITFNSNTFPNSLFVNVLAYKRKTGVNARNLFITCYISSQFRNEYSNNLAFSRSSIYRILVQWYDQVESRKMISDHLYYPSFLVTA
jgi:hypothetical protein